MIDIMIQAVSAVSMSVKAAVIIMDQQQHYGLELRYFYCYCGWSGWKMVIMVGTCY